MNLCSSAAHVERIRHRTHPSSGASVVERQPSSRRVCPWDLNRRKRRKQSEVGRGISVDSVVSCSVRAHPSSAQRIRGLMRRSDCLHRSGDSTIDDRPPNFERTWAADSGSSRSVRRGREMRCCLQVCTDLGQDPTGTKFRSYIRSSPRTPPTVDSSSLPFCVRFNIRFRKPPYTKAATLDTGRVASAYPGGIPTR